MDGWTDILDMPSHIKKDREMATRKWLTAHESKWKCSKRTLYLHQYFQFYRNVHLSWIFILMDKFDYGFIPIFVHDGINSVADYNSLWVGVGCMDVWMYEWMSRGKFHDGITSKRLEILGWNFVWCLILMICLGNEPIEKIGPPQPPQPPYPPQTDTMG